jgi:hypothetical protein
MQQGTSARWQTLTALQWLLLLLLLGAFPLFSLIERLHGNSYTVALVIYVFLFATVGYVVATWKCPRCGQSFHNRSFERGVPYRTACVHCGLKRGSDLSPNLR